MRFLFCTLAVICSFLFCLQVQAKLVTVNDITPKIKKHILNHYKDLYTGNIEVTCGRMPMIPYDAPDGKLNIAVESNLGDQFVERTVARVIITVDGVRVKALGVPVKLDLYDNVYVATEPIHRNEAITGMNVKVSRRNITQIAMTAAIASNDYLNTRVTKTFRTGEILDGRFIEKDPDVMRNSMVNVIFKSDNIAISLPCEAMETGSVGDNIRVKSKDYKKTFTGKIVGKATIVVNI